MPNSTLVLYNQELCGLKKYKAAFPQKLHLQDFECFIPFICHPTNYVLFWLYTTVKQTLKTFNNVTLDTKRTQNING